MRIFLTFLFLASSAFATTTPISGLKLTGPADGNGQALTGLSALSASAISLSGSFSGSDFVTLGTSGAISDSGYSAASFAAASHTHTSAAITDFASAVDALVVSSGTVGGVAVSSLVSSTDSRLSDSRNASSIGSVPVALGSGTAGEALVYTGSSFALGSTNLAVGWGGTLWVDAAKGSDSTGTPTRADLPYATIQAAIASATSGQIVYVRPGSYTGTVVLSANIPVFCDPGVKITGTSNPAICFPGNSSGSASFYLLGYADVVGAGNTNGYWSVISGTISAGYGYYYASSGTGNFICEINSVTTGLSNATAVSALNLSASTGAASPSRVLIRRGAMAYYTVNSATSLLGGAGFSSTVCVTGGASPAGVAIVDIGSVDNGYPAGSSGGGQVGLAVGGCVSARVGAMRYQTYAFATGAGNHLVSGTTHADLTLGVGDTLGAVYGHAGSSDQVSIHAGELNIVYYNAATGYLFSGTATSATPSVSLDCRSISVIRGIAANTTTGDYTVNGALISRSSDPGVPLWGTGTSGTTATNSLSLNDCRLAVAGTSPVFYFPYASGTNSLRIGGSLRLYSPTSGATALGSGTTLTINPCGAIYSNVDKGSGVTVGAGTFVYDSSITQ